MKLTERFANTYDFLMTTLGKEKIRQHNKKNQDNTK